MNGQNYINPFDINDRTDQYPNIPIVNPDPIVDPVPENAVLMNEVPMEETVVPVDLVNEPLAGESPLSEPLNADLMDAVPMEETNTPTNLVNESLAVESPMVEPPVEIDQVVETVVHEPPMETPATHDVPISPNVGPVALLKKEDSEHFRARWNEIQGMFVDEPRAAVQQADGLVSEVMDQITQMFGSEHTSLEGQWNQGDEVSTEDLRKALQRYRSFFNRLVV
ncbi:MAG TPA: hypothetical protein VN452_05780 [Longilinea sp.]|nr:hypothetical protein [Longilinea sp.]